MKFEDLIKLSLSKLLLKRTEVEIEYSKILRGIDLGLNELNNLLKN